MSERDELAKDLLASSFVGLASANIPMCNATAWNEGLMRMPENCRLLAQLMLEELKNHPVEDK